MSVKPSNSVPNLTMPKLALENADEQSRNLKIPGIF